MAVPHCASDRRSLLRGRAPLVLVAFVFLAVVAAALVALSSTGRDFEARRSALCGEAAAFALSEAGIGAAVFDLRIGGNGNVGCEDLPIRHGPGSYWVETQRRANEQYTLTAVGRVGPQLHRTTILARVREESGILELDAVSRESAPIVQD